MKYAYQKELEMGFLQAIQMAKEGLRKQGFGVLFEVDIQQTLKEKLGIDYGKYVILGACNPPLAFRALKADKQVGLFLPCNVIVYEENGRVYVAAILPSAAMSAVENREVKEVASEAERRLKSVIEKL